MMKFHAGQAQGEVMHTSSNSIDFDEVYRSSEKKR